MIYFCSILLFQTWVFYPALVIALGRLKRPSLLNGAESAPLTTTIVIPVYNSADLIVQKIENCRALEHGAEIPIIVVSDGSTDNIKEVIKEISDQNLTLLSLKRRSGKSAAQNKAVKALKTDLILFTDVDALLEKNALTILKMILVRSPNVACAGGRIEFVNSNLFQKLYWRFENALRNAESKLGLLTSISGAAFLVRADKFVELDEDTGDDMVIPLDMALHHQLNTVFADQIIGGDRLAKNGIDILRSRRRITQRNLLVIARRRKLLNPVKRPLLAFSILSHKILRWLTPFLLICILISTVLAIISHMSGWVTTLTVLLSSFILYLARNSIIEIAGLFMGVIDFFKKVRTTYY